MFVPRAGLVAADAGVSEAEAEVEAPLCLLRLRLRAVQASVLTIHLSFAVRVS